MATRAKPPRDPRTEDCAYCRHEVDHASLGHDLRAEREKVGLSQKEVAYAIGLSPAYLCDLELGRRSWTAGRVAKYLAAIRGKAPA